jgi:hypothetical protein
MLTRRLVEQILLLVDGQNQDEISTPSAAHLIWSLFRLVQSSPQEIIWAEHLAQQLVLRGQFQLTRLVLTRLLQFEPESAPCYALLAQVLWAEGLHSPAFLWSARTERLASGFIGFPLRPLDIALQNGDWAAVWAGCYQSGVSTGSIEAIPCLPVDSRLDISINQGNRLVVNLRPTPLSSTNEREYTETYALDHVIGHGPWGWAFGQTFSVASDGARRSFHYSSDRRLFIRSINGPGDAGTGRVDLVPGYFYDDMTFRFLPAFRPIWQFGEAVDFDLIRAANDSGKAFRLVFHWPDGSWRVHPVLLVFCHLHEREITVLSHPMIYPALIERNLCGLSPVLNELSAEIPDDPLRVINSLPCRGAFVRGQYTVSSLTGITEVPAGSRQTAAPSLIRLDVDDR